MNIGILLNKQHTNSSPNMSKKIKHCYDSPDGGLTWKVLFEGDSETCYLDALEAKKMVTNNTTYNVKLSAKCRDENGEYWVLIYLVEPDIPIRVPVDYHVNEEECDEHD